MYLAYCSGVRRETHTIVRVSCRGQQSGCTYGGRHFDGFGGGERKEMGILRLLLEVVVRGGDVRRAQKFVKASKNCRPPSWGVLCRMGAGGAKFSV